MTDQTEPAPLSQPGQSGGANLAAGGDITTGGDIVGRDKNITTITNIITPAPGAPVKYATRADYLAQIIDRHQDLEFVGIPELKDRQALRIEDVFIHLQAEVEIGWDDIIQKTIETPPSAPITSEQALAWATTGPVLEHVAKHYSPEKVKRRVSANEVLREYQRLVILGDPGAGKTTLLKYIAVAFAQRQSDKLDLSEDRLPIFVRLYDYVAKKAERREDYSLVRYLYTQAEENLSLKLEPEFFEAELERGNCCVCLDGLDELGGAGLRREVTNAVAALANHYPHNRFIVTSRLVGYEEAPLDRREFVHHTVLPLTDDDIREFVKKWYSAREKDPASSRERAEHLTKTIMSEPRIKSLAANPLMLTIVALVHRIEAELPHERVKLYDKCVTALVETWEKVKGFNVEDRERPYYKYRRRLLEQLAFWMHSQPGVSGRTREVKEGDLELQLARFLMENPKLQLDDERARQEAQAFIALAKSRTGLLVERGEEVYSFAHLTFQEYLAACDIEHRLAHSIDAIWGEIRPRLHNSHWREVILLLLGSLNKFERHPTELVRCILKRRDKCETVLHRHLFFAARVLADRVEVEAKLYSEIVDGLIEIVRSDELARDDAAVALSALQDDARAVEGLLMLAFDKQVNVQIRGVALEALGQSSRAVDSTVSTLINLATNEKENARTRVDAAQAIIKLGRINDSVLSNLFAIAQNPQAQRETWAYYALSVLGQLCQSSEIVRVGLLEVAYNQQMEDRIRVSAARSLRGLSQTDKVVELLLKMASDRQLRADARVTACYGLAELGKSEEAIASLSDLVRDKQVDNIAKHNAVMKLTDLGRAKEAMLAVNEMVHDKQYDDTSLDSTLHVMVVRLTEAGETVISNLRELADNRQIDSRVRGVALLSLLHLGGSEEAVMIMSRIAEAQYLNDRLQQSPIENAADLTRSNGVQSQLLWLARNEHMDLWVRTAAMQALGQLGHVHEASRLLLTVIYDRLTSIWIKHIAAQALVQLSHIDEDVISRLLVLMRDREIDLWVRHDIVVALGPLSRTNKAGLKELLELARNEQDNDWVRRAAYESLKALLGMQEGEKH